MKTLYILPLLLLIGCSGEEDSCSPDFVGEESNTSQICISRLNGEIRVSASDFTSRRHEWMLEAVDTWNKRTDNRVNISFIITDDNPNVFMVDTIFNKGHGEGEELPAGMATFPDGHIEVRSDLIDAWYKPAMMHEIGHYLGLCHHGTFQIMTKRVTSVELEQADIDAFDALYAKGLR